MRSSYHQLSSPSRNLVLKTSNSNFKICQFSNQQSTNLKQNTNLKSYDKNESFRNRFGSIQSLLKNSHKQTMERNKYISMKQSIRQKLSMIKTKTEKLTEIQVFKTYKYYAVQILMGDLMYAIKSQCKQKGQVLQFLWTSVFDMLEQVFIKKEKIFNKQQKDVLKKSIENHENYQKRIVQLTQKQKFLENQLQYNKIFIDNLISNLRLNKKQVKKLKIYTKNIKNQLNNARQNNIELKIENIDLLVENRQIGQQQAKRIQNLKQSLNKQKTKTFKIMKQKKNKEEIRRQLFISKKQFQKNLQKQIQQALKQSLIQNTQAFFQIIDQKIDNFDLINEFQPKQQSQICINLDSDRQKIFFSNVSTDTFGLKVSLRTVSQQTQFIEKLKNQAIKNGMAQTHPISVWKSNFGTQVNINDIKLKKEKLKMSKRFEINYHPEIISILNIKNQSNCFQSKKKISSKEGKLNIKNRTYSTLLENKQKKNKNLKTQESQVNKAISNSISNFKKQSFLSQVQTPKKSSFYQQFIKSTQKKQSKLKKRRQIRDSIQVKHQNKNQKQVDENLDQVIQNKSKREKSSFTRFSSIFKNKLSFLGQNPLLNSFHSIELQHQSNKCSQLSIKQDQDYQINRKIQEFQIKRFSSMRKALILDDAIRECFQTQQINQFFSQVQIKDFDQNQILFDIFKLIAQLSKVKYHPKPSVKGILKTLSIIYNGALTKLQKNTQIKNMTGSTYEYLELAYGHIKGINKYQKMLNFLVNCIHTKNDHSGILQFLKNTNLDIQRQAEQKANKISSNFKFRTPFQIKMHLNIVFKLSINCSTPLDLENLYTTQNKIKESLPSLLRQQGINEKQSKYIFNLLISVIEESTEYYLKDSLINSTKKKKQKCQIQIDIFKCSDFIIETIIQLRNKITKSYEFLNKIFLQKPLNLKEKYQKIQLIEYNLDFLKLISELHCEKKFQMIKNFEILDKLKKKKESKSIITAQYFIFGNILPFDQVIEKLFKKYQIVNVDQNCEFLTKIFKKSALQNSQIYFEENKIDLKMIKYIQTSLQPLRSKGAFDMFDNLTKNKPSSQLIMQIERIKEAILLKIAQKRINQVFQYILGQDISFIYGLSICSSVDNFFIDFDNKEENVNKI